MNHNTTMFSTAELKTDSLSSENLTIFEELSEEEASTISGGGAPKPSDSGINLVPDEPENQIPSISLRGIGMNHNTTMVSTAELKTDSTSSENLTPFEQLAEEKASAISGGGDPKPRGGGGINLVFTQPENQIPSIFRSRIRINHNTTVVSITELNTLGSSW